MKNVLYRNHRSLAVFLCLLCATILFFGGCSQEQKTKGAVTENGQQVPVYTIGDATGDWGYPSPFTHYLRGPGYIRMSLVFDTLIWKDEKGFVPALAHSWEYIESENAYLFELTDKAQWHDGTKFTANDVVFTFNYYKKHPYSFADTTKIAKVEAISDNVIKIYLKEKYAPFLNNVAGVAPILPEHIWKNVDNPNEFSEPKAVVGTGPYKLLDYNKEQGSYLFESFDEYYLGKPLVEQVKFIKISKEMAGAALQRGEVDFVQIPPDLKDQLSDQGIELLKTKHDWVLKLLINHQKEPFADKDFRQALAYAINRQELVENTLRGHGLPGSQGLFSPDYVWYNENVDKYDYEPKKAKAIIENYKVEPIELLISPDYEREGQLIKKQLEEIGLKVTLVSLEAKTLDARINEWKFDLAISGHGAVNGDAEILNRMILGKTFVSARYESNLELTKLLKEQIAIMDEAERQKKVKEIQELYAQELPCISLYYPDWYFGHDGTIKLIQTDRGVGSGIPIPLNKLSFIRY